MSTVQTSARAATVASIITLPLLCAPLAVTANAVPLAPIVLTAPCVQPEIALSACVILFSVTHRLYIPRHHDDRV